MAVPNSISVTYLTDNGEITIFLEPSDDETCDLQLTWETPEVPNEDISTIGEKKIRFDIASTRNWPEFKTEMVRECRRTPLGRICANVPRLFTRTCDKKVFAEISFPQSIEDAVTDAVTKCGLAAAVASAAVAISGGAVAASPVFTASFKACIDLSAYEYASRIRIRVKDETSCSRWIPR